MNGEKILSEEADKLALLHQLLANFMHADPWVDAQGVEHQGPEVPCHEHTTVIEWSETHKGKIRDGGVVSRHYTHPKDPNFDRHLPARGIAHTSGPRPQHLSGLPDVLPSDAAWDIEAAGREKAAERRQWATTNKQVATLTRAMLRQQAMALGLI